MEMAEEVNIEAETAAAEVAEVATTAVAAVA
jgi:hypothetical protein